MSKTRKRKSRSKKMMTSLALAVILASSSLSAYADADHRRAVSKPFVVQNGPHSVADYNDLVSRGVIDQETANALIAFSQQQER